ncbi:MAG: DUF4292 domain-containing protein [Bacteroidota bacterium]|nr:DUF4292 domain-containing protein [Bacteroidota bacterium]
MIPKITTIDFSVPPKNATELITRVDSKNNHPQWLSLKGRGHIIKKNQESAFNINIKHKRDSVIWLSASGPFGIEIIRAQLTPDSVYFVNRINKTYLTIPISRAKSFIKRDLSFYDFQDMITANLKIAKKNYKLEVDEIGFYLSSENFSCFITNDYRIQNAKFVDEKTSLEFILGDHQERDNFPRKVILRLAAEEAFEVMINYSKVEFNKPQKILFEIPNSYDEIK